MKIKGDDMSVIESGYYADDIRKDDMRNDRYNKPFTIYDIFADEDLPSASFDAKNISMNKPQRGEMEEVCETAEMAGKIR